MFAMSWQAISAASIQNVASVVENFSKRKMSWVRKEAAKKEPWQTFVTENSWYININYGSLLHFYLFIIFNEVSISDWLSQLSHLSVQ